MNNQCKHIWSLAHWIRNASLEELHGKAFMKCIECNSQKELVVKGGPLVIETNNPKEECRDEPMRTREQ